MTDLQLYVIGGAKGESIIIKTPGDKWGVIDCYSPSISDTRQNTCLQILLDKKIKELDFLCLTHPDDDHFRGMSHLLDAFQIKEFWRFGGFSPTELDKILAIIAAQSNVSVDTEKTENSQELSDIFNRVQEIKTTEIELSDCKLLRNERNFEIWSIAPPSELVSKYKGQVLSKFGSSNPEEVRKLKHNLTSVALLIKFGQTQVILGGDVENQGWKIIIPQLQNKSFSLCSDMVKVSHHGSEGAYTPELWDLFCERCKSNAVITPFLRHGLPSEAGLQNILSHTSNTYVCFQLIGEGFEFTPDTDLDVQLAHRDFWSQFYADEQSESGVCILSFDDSCHLTKPVDLKGKAIRAGRVLI